MASDVRPATSATVPTSASTAPAFAASLRAPSRCPARRGDLLDGLRDGGERLARVRDARGALRAASAPSRTASTDAWVSAGASQVGDLRAASCRRGADCRHDGEPRPRRRRGGLDRGVSASRFVCRRERHAVMPPISSEVEPRLPIVARRSRLATPSIASSTRAERELALRATSSAWSAAAGRGGAIAGVQGGRHRLGRARRARPPRPARGRPR